MNKKKSNLTQDTDYSDKDIEVLEGVQAIRHRPGMYVGDIGNDGFNHIINEVLDNCLDEHLTGFASQITIEIDDNLITITDNGRGLPSGYNDKYKKSNIEVLLTQLHSGAKFNNKSYSFSSGLHGVGLCVVNALSTYMKVISKRDNLLISQEYSKGNLIKKFEPQPTSETGTVISFKIDTSIINGKPDYERISKRLFELSCLNPKLKLYIKYNNSSQNFLNNDLFKLSKKGTIKNFYYEKEIKTPNMNCVIEFIFNFSDKETILSYVNNVNTTEGGTHVNIIRNILYKFFLQTINIPELETNDFKKYLNLTINFKINNPIFSGQTKYKLSNPLTGLNQILQKDLELKLKQHFITNSEDLKFIIEILKRSIKERKTSLYNKELKKELFIDSATFAGKLADCSNSNLEEREIFLVEGSSAGGSAIQSRDRKSQAVFCMKGKIINTAKNPIEKIRKNQEIFSLVSTLGLKYGEPNENESLRYGKIIIMADRDPDGDHIKNLCMTLFYYNFRYIIEAGRLYIANPPLFGVRKNPNGEVEKYFNSEKELEEFLKIKSNKKYFVQRFKGLGELNPTQLFETSMNPNNRNLIQCKLTDLEKTQMLFLGLMGNKVNYRRQIVFELMGDIIDPNEIEDIQESIYSDQLE